MSELIIIILQKLTSSCDKNEFKGMLERKWKIVEVIQKGEGGSYWDFDCDMLDLTDFKNFRNNSPNNIEKENYGNIIISIPNTQAYFEVLNVSETDLKLSFNFKDLETGKGYTASEIYCKPLE